MALLITYDGFGVVANADDEDADTAGGHWAEDGAGAISINPDVSIYGNSSFGSKYATKIGYSYFVSDNTFNFAAAGAQEGQYIYIWLNILGYSPFYTIANEPFNLFVSSSGDASQTSEWTIAGKNDANGWIGGWKLFVLDPTTTPNKTTGGGADLSAIDSIGLYIATDVSVRSESIFINQITIAKGLKVEGTSTNMYDEVVAWAEDYPNRAAGMFQSRGQGYYSLGSLNVHSDTANTVVSSEGNSIEYEKSEFYNGTVWTTLYPTDANLITVEATGGNTCTISDTNIGISGNVDNNVSLTTTTATSYTKFGGFIKHLDTLSAVSGDSFQGVVFSLYTARTVGSETYTGCTFDGSSVLTLSASSDFDNNNTINGAAGITSLTTPDLSFAATTSLSASSGGNHGVRLTSLGGGSMTWNCSTSGFEGGSTGSPVTSTSTGNEDIFVDVASGSLTINVASGATIPSIRSAGAVITVVAGQVTTSITVKDIDTGLVISGAQVLVLVSDGVNFPYLDSVTATSSGTIATITHTGHGLVTGDDVLINGANEPEYNGAFNITFVDSNTYSYTMTSSSVSPATGSLVATLVLINGVTDINGVISDSRSLSLDQAITGRVRKSSSSPFYKTSPITGTVDSTNGISITQQLIGDE